MSKADLILRPDSLIETNQSSSKKCFCEKSKLTLLLICANTSKIEILEWINRCEMLRFEQAVLEAYF